MAGDGVLEEELFISSDKYIDTITDFWSEIEKQMETDGN